MDPAIDLTPLTSERISILIVDDEESIRRTLEGVFRDEGYQASSADSGAAALELLSLALPSLVLLDIWMPGMDGIETLKRIKALYPALPVIMISGHATIATAVTATRLGASDFIEKPLDLNVILDAVHKVIEAKRATPHAAVPESGEIESWQGAEVDPSRLNRIVFSKQTMRGRALKQRSLASSAVLYGQGLHSGRKSGLLLQPLPADSGIHFMGVSEQTVIPAHLDFVESTGWSTTIKLGRTQAATIEHLMSALHAYGISNLLIKCNGEVPVMDGSALEFCNLFEETGLEEQDGEWYEIAVDEPITISKGREQISLEPAEDFSMRYILEYPAPIGRQELEFKLTGPADYKQMIAPARTFGFVRDIGALQRQGLALGGRFDNFVLIGEGGPVNTELRFSDEMVRHKILDAIGDLYLLGRPIRARITAHMTGHSDNVALLKQLDSLLKSA